MITSPPLIHLFLSPARSAVRSAVRAGNGSRVRQRGDAILRNTARADLRLRETQVVRVESIGQVRDAGKGWRTKFASAPYHRVMIAKIAGHLESVQEGAVMVRTEGGLTYEVLVPAYVVARLGDSEGAPAELHTLDFIEGQAQGAVMTPRLAGFLTREDRDFFELFTTCKGIGNRRALRAMTLETGQIAAAIADRDAALLQSLPEIGKRTAETIIVTLRDKVESFVGAAAYATVAHRGAEGAENEAPGGSRTMAREALEVMLRLGESRSQCVVWIDEALRQEEQPADTQALIERVYTIKAGAGV